MQFASKYTTSCVLSATILTDAVIENALKAYFKNDYISYMHADDVESQRAGIDIRVATRCGKIHAVDLKACRKSVADALDLEVYSVREARKLGYLLKNDSLCTHVLFIDASGAWRMFRRETLAGAFRKNFKNWASRFGVRIQRTRCSWRSTGDYSSSTIRVTTNWIRGAYYAQANLA